MAVNDSQSDDPSEDSPKGRDRVPLERKISLKFKEFRGFITEYSANISPGGMFIITDTPQEPGSVFDFEFRLADDDFQIIHGLGEVVWVREGAQGPERPRGMGIRFLHLDEGSRELIERMVEEHVRSGGTPFDLDGAAPREDELDVGSPGPGEPPASASGPSEVPSPEAGGYGLPTDTAGEGTESETPSVAASTGSKETEGGPGEDRGSLERFDAALASLKTARKEDEDLPPGFEEVSAALSGEEEREELVDPDELPEGVVAPPPPSTGQGEPSSDLEERPQPGTPDESFGDLPRPNGAASPRSGTTNRFARRLLLGLLVVAAVAVAVHFVLPGGLPAVLGGQGPEPPAPSEQAPAPPDAGLPTPETRSASETASETVSETVPEAVPDAMDEGAPSETVSETAPAATDPAPQPPEEPFRIVEGIDWSQEEGRTVFELTTDGLVEEGRYRSFTLGGGNPRVLLRLRDVARPYSPSTLEVGSDQVSRIRLGYHREPAGNELHVVFDLTSSRVEPISIAPDGNRLRVILGTPGF